MGHAQTGIPPATGHRIGNALVASGDKSGRGNSVTTALHHLVMLTNLGQDLRYGVRKLRLLQTIANFVQSGPGAVVIQLSAGCATCANRSNRLIP